MDKVRALTRRSRHRTLADLLRQLNPVLRGWCNYFRHGVSKRTFGYVDHFAWWRIVGWLRNATRAEHGHLVRRYLPGWEISDGGVAMFRPRAVPSLDTATGHPHPHTMGERHDGTTAPAA